MRTILLATTLAATPCALAGCNKPDESSAARTASATATASAAIASAAAPSVSADPPRATERLARVSSPAAPLLPEIEPDEGAAQVPRAGDLVYVMDSLAPLKWKGRMGEVEATREGPMVTVRRAAGDGRLFGFKSDLGDEIEVPAAPGLCARLAAALPELLPGEREACPLALRRAKLADGALVVYHACVEGPCPVGVLRGERLSAVTVDGVIDARLVTIAARPALVTTTRWVREQGKVTGGVIVTVTLDSERPTIASRIATDEVDARPPVLVLQRNVKVEIGATEVHIVGDQRAVDRNTGKEQGKKPIDERHPLLGK